MLSSLLADHTNTDVFEPETDAGQLLSALRTVLPLEYNLSTYIERHGKIQYLLLNDNVVLNNNN